MRVKNILGQQEKKETGHADTIFSWSIYIIVILSTASGGILCKTPFADIVMDVVFSFVGALIFVYFYEMHENNMISRISSLPFFLFSFAISYMFLVLSVKVNTGSLWLFAVAVIAVCDGMNYAISCHLLMILQYILLITDNNIDNGSLELRKLIFYAVSGALLALLMSEISKKRAFIYAAIVFMILSAAMLVVTYKFVLSDIENDIEFVASYIIGALLIFTSAYFVYIHKEYKAKKAVLRLNNKLNTYLEDSSDIKLRLKEYSESLYAHSVLVGELSASAADLMECNDVLARAGGMFHEAGKLIDEKNYVNAASLLAREYDFPKELSDIIRQRSTVYEKPKSMEAAIVMLSDCIVSTCEYLERTGKRENISDEELVANIFDNRLSKGSLDEAGMTDEQIQKLMGFYIKQVGKEQTLFP